MGLSRDLQKKFRLSEVRFPDKTRECFAEVRTSRQRVAGETPKYGWCSWKTVVAAVVQKDECVRIGLKVAIKKGTVAHTRWGTDNVIVRANR